MPPGNHDARKATKGRNVSLCEGSTKPETPTLTDRATVPAWDPERGAVAAKSRRADGHLSAWLDAEHSGEEAVANAGGELDAGEVVVCGGVFGYARVIDEAASQCGQAHLAEAASSESGGGLNADGADVVVADTDRVAFGDYLAAVEDATADLSVSAEAHRRGP